jgi:hypothetical protein
MIDEQARAKPEAAYDYAGLFAGLIPDGGDQASSATRSSRQRVRPLTDECPARPGRTALANRP